MHGSIDECIDQSTYFSTFYEADKGSETLICNCQASIISGLLSWNLAVLSHSEAFHYLHFILRSSFSFDRSFSSFYFLLLPLLLLFTSSSASFHMLSQSVLMSVSLLLCLLLNPCQSPLILQISDPSLMLTSLSFNFPIVIKVNITIISFIMAKPFDFLNYSNCPVQHSILHHQITIVPITAYHLRTTLSTSA